MVANVVAVRRHHAAEVLRPWTVEGAVDDGPADAAHTQVLRLRRKSEEGINLARGEQLNRPRRGASDPAYILARVEPDMGDHGAQEQMWARAQTLHTDALALEIGDAADAFAREQLEATDMLPADDRDWLTGIDRDEECGGIICGEVNFTAGER